MLRIEYFPNGYGVTLGPTDDDDWEKTVVVVLVRHDTGDHPAETMIVADDDLAAVLTAIQQRPPRPR